MNKFTYHKNNNLLCVVLITIIAFILCVSLAVFNIELAQAITNSEDKLYGETLSSRGMSVADCPGISAQYSVIISKSGKVIFERNAYEPTQIASLTKIMTAVVALDCSSLTDKLTVSKKAVEVGESSAGLWQEDTLSIETALYALLVPSGNDSAQAIAEKVGEIAIKNKDDRIRKKSAEEVENEATENNIDPDDVKDIYIDDPEEAFVALMNWKAKEIGCVKTNFTNPHGLADEDYYNENQYSCAYDIGIISRYAMQNELFRKIVGGGDTVITVERNGHPTEIELATTDILIGSFEGCVGVKTGNTEIGGPCFSGAYHDAENDEIYTIVLKSEDETVRFVDTQNLFNWYITNKVSVDLTDGMRKQTMHINDTDKEVGIVAEVSHNQWADCTIPVTIKDQDKAIPVLSIAGNLHLKLDNEEVSGDFKAGDKVCELILSQHDNEVGRVDLIATQDQHSPNIFQTIGVAFDRVFRNISGNNTVAESKILANCDKVNNKNVRNKKQEN